MRLIIYDLDGTLVDTLDDITQAANVMLRQMGRPPLSPAQVRPLIGHGVHDLVRRALDTVEPTRVEEGVKRFRAYYAQHFLDRSRLYPGAAEVLVYFRSRHQAIITNKPNPFSREILTGLGVAEYFVELIAGDSPHPKKPNPAAVHAVMACCGVTPADTVFVGDSAIDVETGRNAGVLTVGVTHGFGDAQELAAASPEAIVQNFQELLELAQRRGW